MSFTSIMLAALHLCTATPAASHSAVTVGVNLALDRSVASTAIKRAAGAEAAAVWRPYGVDLVFDQPFAPSALSLDVIVERGPRRSTELSMVLGRTIVGPPPQAPVRISFDAVDALIEHRHGNPLLHDFVIAIALGRVLAHEIGHILLGAPSYHDEAGLMRTTFLPDDLARPDRSSFQLSERSVARLRARVAAWSGNAARTEGTAGGVLRLAGCR